MKKLLFFVSCFPLLGESAQATSIINKSEQKVYIRLSSMLKRNGWYAPYELNPATNTTQQIDFGNLIELSNHLEKKETRVGVSAGKDKDFGKVPCNGEIIVRADSTNEKINSRTSITINPDMSCTVVQK